MSCDFLQTGRQQESWELKTGHLTLANELVITELGLWERQAKVDIYQMSP